MKKRLLISLVLLIFLTTYSYQNNFKIKSYFKIDTIEVINNEIINEETIKKQLSFVYQNNILFLKKKKITKALSKISFIESYEIKKIFPNKIKVKIYEKKPIVVMQNKNEKYFYTKKGETIDFFEIEKFKNLPIVFGKKEKFKIFYANLLKLDFPLKEIKTFYSFRSNRWDIVTNNDQTIKLPSQNYDLSLKNFLRLKDQRNFEKYKVFDYRIKDQLILK